MIVKLLTEHHLEFLSLKGGCRGSSESTLVKMSICWKSHATAHISVMISQPSFDMAMHGPIQDSLPFSLTPELPGGGVIPNHHLQTIYPVELTHRKTTGSSMLCSP